MNDSFFTIASPSTGTYKDRGSKFMAFAHPVTDSEQIRVILSSLKKEYFDAQHHCYAWMLGAGKDQSKTYDDGEPNHTAGDPILGQIRSKNLTNILVVVVRYFGGTKLGVSGLINAYKTAAAEALSHAQLVEQFLVHRYVIEYDYPQTSLVMSLVKEFDLALLNQEFMERCKIMFEIRMKSEPGLIEKIKTWAAQGNLITLSPISETH